MSLSTRLVLVLSVLAIAGPALADGAIVRLLTPADKGRLERFDATRATAIADARARGAPADVAALERALSGKPMSVRQFERKFHKAYQVSPRGYLVRMRVAAASDLLRTTDLRPSEIAHQTGFYDASDFSRQFRRAMKVSPTEFRRHLKA